MMKTEFARVSNRRSHPRRLACWPAEVVQRTQAAPSAGILRDISESGALLLLETELDVGHEVEVELHAPHACIRAVGQVVRTTSAPKLARTFWRHTAAIHFVRPLDAEPTTLAILEGLEPLPERRAHRN